MSSTTISPPRERQLLARRPRGGEEPHLVGGKIALFQQFPHDGADLPGRADDSDTHAHGLSPRSGVHDGDLVAAQIEGVVQHLHRLVEFGVA